MSAPAPAFTPPVRPEGCICDPLTFMDQNDIPPVCDEFRGSAGNFRDRYCLTCEHDYECHKVPA
jgi:hypothetical protein